MKFNVIISVLVLFLSSCKETEQSLSIITFTNGNVMVNDIKASAGMILKVNDVIKTDKASCALIQINNRVMIVIQENTEINICQLEIANHKADGIIEVHFGEIFSKIIKGSNGYSVRTPTIVAAARGTSFSISYNNISGSSSVSLLEGRLSIVSVKEKSEFAGDANGGAFDLNQGAKIDIGANLSVIKQYLNESETEILKKLDMIQPENIFSTGSSVRNVGQLTGDGQARVTAISEAQKNRMLNILSYQRGQDTKQTYEDKLQEMKIRNNGQLDMLIIADGRKIEGVLEERGMVYKIRTPSGIEIIPRDDVVSQVIIK